MKDVDLDRLLRAAASQKDAPAEMPFGFDTRVLAQCRAQTDTSSVGLTRLVRRVALMAVGIIVVAAAGAYIETDRTHESNEPFANEFAIADAAIQDAIEP